MPGGYEANQIGSAVPATAGAGALCVSSVMESNPRRPRTAASANLRQISPTRNRPSPSSSRKAGEKKTKRSRGALASEFCQVLRSQFASPRKTEGSGAPKGASNQCPRVFRARKRAKCRGALAFRRSAAALASAVATASGSALEPRFLGRGWGGCFARLGPVQSSELLADRSFCRPSGAPKPPGNRTAKSR
jgi:hypothetical protein